MTRIGHPQSELLALLDALECELLAASADEVRDAWRETGRARHIACQEVRALLNEAITTSEEDLGTGLDRLRGVSRELRPAASFHSRANAFPAWSYRRH
jgi:hypothetical protein